MDAFVTWLQATPLSQAIVYHTWIWPACETLHFIGLALIIGIVGFFDLRLIGFFKRIPVNAARDLMPFAIAGFVLNLVTGVIFLIGHPEQYAHNIAWWYKVGSLALAGLNARDVRDVRRRANRRARSRRRYAHDRKGHRRRLASSRGSACSSGAGCCRSSETHSDDC